MSQKHFNRSVSPSQHTQFNSIAIVKWRIRVKATLLSKQGKTMTNGGGETKWQTQGEAIIISRRDVETVYEYAHSECDLRDHLMIRLPMKIGLRTREISTLTVEDIDFETRSFNVLDSKKHRFYPIPLDILTLQLIQDLTADIEGLVFRHKTYKKNEGKPLTNVTVWKLFKSIGEAAGVKRFNPRLCRHYFAANSMYPEPDENGECKEPMKVETLRRILRHKKAGMTHVYLARLVFIEDIKKDYDRLQNPYVNGAGFELAAKSRFYEEYCSKCTHEPMCKFKTQMCSSNAASGCRFYKQKKEMII